MQRQTAREMLNVLEFLVVRPSFARTLGVAENLICDIVFRLAIHNICHHPNGSHCIVQTKMEFPVWREQNYFASENATCRFLCTRHKDIFSVWSILPLLSARQLPNDEAILQLRRERADLEETQAVPRFWLPNVWNHLKTTRLLFFSACCKHMWPEMFGKWSLSTAIASGAPSQNHSNTKSPSSMPNLVWRQATRASIASLRISLDSCEIRNKHDGNDRVLPLPIEIMRSCDSKHQLCQTLAGLIVCCISKKPLTKTPVGATTFFTKVEKLFSK